VNEYVLYGTDGGLVLIALFRLVGVMFLIKVILSDIPRVGIDLGPILRPSVPLARPIPFSRLKGGPVWLGAHPALKGPDISIMRTHPSCKFGSNA
jgi:hypothetical protein